MNRRPEPFQLSLGGGVPEVIELLVRRRTPLWVTRDGRDPEAVDRPGAGWAVPGTPTRATPISGR